MSDRVTIHGEGLTVEQETTDPKRRRPSTHTPDVAPVRSPFGWTLEEMVQMPNPFHDEDGAHYDGNEP